MYISINWIKDFVNLDGIDIKELINQVTMSTAEVEGYEVFGEDTTGVVVGKVIKKEQIPTSHKLSKVQIDVGEDIVQSVCGAPNIQEGMKVVFARAGSKVKGVMVKSSMIEGEESNGVCLSEKELGISEDHTGVMVLPQESLVGEDIKKIIPLEDTVFEIDNKSLTNRPDLWGHYGIAREIAAITGRELKPLEIEDLEQYQHLPKVDVKVEDGKDCQRYTAIKVQNITRKVSPYQMKIRLYYCGSRGINLLADLTNYIMLELGQPMHAFDNRFVDAIEVKKLKEEKEFTTLDGISRKLEPGMLMICNQKEEIGIAGVMGGENTQILEDTTSLLLESATFDGVLIRKTANKLALRTDAATRYEKTLDPELAKLATARFLKLLKELDPTVEIVSSFTDIYLTTYPHITIHLDKPYIDRMIGIDIPMDRICHILTSLQYTLKVENENITVEVPTFRATKDVTQKADIIEEISRIYGYDNIIPQTNYWPIKLVREDEERVMEYEVKKLLATKYGMSEIHSYVWYDTEKNRELGIEVKDNLKIVNALNKSDSTLRETMLPTMLYALDKNLKYFDDCQVFEVGRTFSYPEVGKNCIEHKVLGIGMASCEDSEKELLLKAKEIVETIVDIEKNSSIQICNVTDNQYAFLHPVNDYRVKVADEEIGEIALVHPKVKGKISSKANICLIELAIDKLNQLKTSARVYQEITKYQTVNVDLSITVDEKVKYQEVENVILQSGIRYLLSYSLVDIYENKEKLKDKKVFTIRFHIGSYDKTLTKEEIDEQRKIMIEKLAENHMIVSLS